MRKPFGENASPPALDGTSSDLISPFALRMKACLPADQATASGPSATRSIQRCLASVASVSLSPLAFVATTLPSSPPVTMRVPSLARVRIPPACTATRCSVPSGETNSSVSSPRANTARSPMKCTATTGAPAETGFTRSVTEGIGPRVSVTGANASGHAALEALADFLFGQIAADEHETALALLVRAPFALVVAVEHHVHALKHEALRIVLQRQDALGPQDVRSLRLREVLDEGEELVRIERLIGLKRNRLHVLVVIVLQPAVRMRIAVIMIVVMVMVVVLGVKKLRLDVEDAFEIERITPE